MFCWLFYHDTTKYHMKRNQHMSLVLVWMTQPPWLHRFHFKWTSAHPIIKHGVVIEVESIFFWAHLSRDFFFNNGPILLTQLLHSKKYSHLPYSYTYVMDFFFKILSFCHHCHCYNGAIARHHCWCSKKN
jgi:hypothetical protein